MSLWIGGVGVTVPFSLSVRSSIGVNALNGRQTRYKEVRGEDNEADAMERGIETRVLEISITRGRTLCMRS